MKLHEHLDAREAEVFVYVVMQRAGFCFGAEALVFVGDIVWF
jgi:hypothetical protein